MQAVQEWVLHLVDVVPELKPLFDAQYAAAHTVDAELFLSSAARWARQRGATPSVVRLLAELDSDYESRGPRVREVIESAFLEQLAGDALAHEFGHNLRRALRPHDLGRGER